MISVPRISLILTRSSNLYPLLKIYYKQCHRLTYKDKWSTSFVIFMCIFIS